MKQRRREWSARIANELKWHAALGKRTWFVTLTWRPESRFRVLSEARKEARRRGVDYDALPQPKQFVFLAGACGEAVTKYLKRVRRTTEATTAFRYVAVVEAHKEAEIWPHFHLLMHETAAQFTERKLKGEWKEGFFHARLADEKAAWYVAKYLSKEALCRIRASAKYGKTASAIALVGLAEEHEKPARVSRKSRSEAEQTTPQREKPDFFAAPPSLRARSAAE